MYEICTNAYVYISGILFSNIMGKRKHDGAVGNSKKFIAGAKGRPKFGTPTESNLNSTQQMVLQAEYFAEQGYPTLAQHLNVTIPEPAQFDISLESLIDVSGWNFINDRFNGIPQPVVEEPPAAPAPPKPPPKHTMDFFAFHTFFS